MAAPRVTARARPLQTTMLPDSPPRASVFVAGNPRREHRDASRRSR